MKGNSISHYLIEFINFILLNQDSTAQTAILACMVDYSKAFNRQNHNIIITKLSDMGVPAWLLKVVMAFLTNRKMKVRYKSKVSSIKDLPGGGPQGTLLGLLLFLVLINDEGFKGQVNNAGELLTSKRNVKKVNEIHLKYVDDLTLAEAVNLSEQLKYESPSNRPLPDNFHARTGHRFPAENSAVQQQLVKTKEYAEVNDMKINEKKTKVMLFNPCRSIDFIPDIQLGGTQLDLVEKAKLLGVVIRSDLKWKDNTEYIVKRAYKKLWMLRRLKGLGAGPDELLDLYVKQVRCLLEMAAPVWHGSLTLVEKADIERVQKAALRLILGDAYENYQNALEIANLETLDCRRDNLCLKFAKRASKHPKFKYWFKEKARLPTRHTTGNYYNPIARTDRLMKGPLSYLTRLLNSNSKK